MSVMLSLFSLKKHNNRSLSHITPSVSIAQIQASAFGAPTSQRTFIKSYISMLINAEWKENKKYDYLMLLWEGKKKPKPNAVNPRGCNKSLEKDLRTQCTFQKETENRQLWALMTDVPWYSDNGGLGQSFQEELHGQDHLLDLLLTTDVVREFREITGQACLMHLDSTPQAQIKSVCGSGNVPQHYKPNETNLLLFTFYLGPLSTGFLHIFHFNIFPDSNLRISVDFFF